MVKLALIVFLIYSNGVQAQKSLSPFSSPFSAYQTSLIDAGLNPASASELDTLELSLFSERKAMMKELQEYTLFFGIPLTKGFVYTSLFYTKLEGFRNSKFSFGYGRKLGSISIGTSVSYENISVHSYTSEKRLEGTAGFMLELSPQWKGGFTFSYSEKNVKGFNFSGGIGLDLSSSLHFFILAHNYYYKPIALLGIRMKEKKMLLSFSFDPAQHFFQLGGAVLFNNTSLGVQTGYQPQLGYTPSLYLQFRKAKP